MARIAAIGEVMVELSPFPTTESTDKEVMALGFAGDTFNTAIYMARTGIQTDYATLLGDDPYSTQILNLASSEKVGTGMIETMPGRLPGMYMIRNAPCGEREFYYWRKEARARELFADKAHTEQLTKQLMTCDYLYFSGITLAIISDHSREMLLNFVDEYRSQGGVFCFDINYRPRLWDCQTQAQNIMMDMMAHADMALLTLDDEAMLWGDGSIEATIERYKGCAVKELILKRGAKEVVTLVDGNEVHIPVPWVEGVVDTTGAGDSFNAGYVSARMQGLSSEEAAKHGIHVASIVIRNRGAIVKKSNFDAEYKGLQL
ncbi:sugar kinase [Teredinibacter haidensis]|uniref:sugar kinase n=1 Tax=Teredinibacter haidensis TaxID=2731755 RepID=UPI000948CC34|nr:sugar kinase [Teredinibacter haidensis]